MTSIPLKVPRENPNDDEVLLTKWYVVDGAHVDVGDIVCSIETTKCAVDLEAPASGPIHQIATSGIYVNVDAVIAFIGDAPILPSPLIRNGVEPIISRPALQRILELGFDPTDFASYITVSVSDVESLAVERDQQNLAMQGPLDLLSGGILIYGTGNAAFLVYDALCSHGVDPEVRGFIDYNPRSTTHLGFPVIHRQRAAEVVAQGVRRAIVAMPSPRETLEAMNFLIGLGFELDNAIHAEAYVSPSARLFGNVTIGARAHIGPYVSLQQGCRVLACASVAHHTKVGAGAIVADGCVIGGSVLLGEEAVLGISVSVNAHVQIGTKARIATGCSLYEDVPDFGIVRLGSRTELKSLTSGSS